MATVSALNVYPVKGCAGNAVACRQVLETGLAGDREWMLVEPSGRFLSQREHPRLCLIRARAGQGSLVLDHPALPPLVVAAPEAGAGSRAVVVWRDTVPALDAGDAAAGWLSWALGTPVRLVRFDTSVRRPCNPRFAGDSGAHTLFADGYPLLVIGSASLADLNGRLRAPLPMDRFRPNLVLDGLDPYDEDYVDTVRVGRLTLRLVKPCTRCQVTTVDQSTGVVAGDEPLSTLSRFRNNPELGGVAFGMNAIVVDGAGASIAVGDEAVATLRF